MIARAWVLICCSFLCIKASSQDFKDSAARQFLKYLDLTNRHQFSEAFELMDERAFYLMIEDTLELMDEDEGAFELITKEVFAEHMEKAIADRGYTYNIDSARIVYISDKIDFEGRTYMQIIYSYVLAMNQSVFLRGQVQSGDKPTKDVIKNVHDKLEIIYGKDKVAYESSSGDFRISFTEKAIANSKDLVRWKFVLVEGPRVQLLKKIVPKEFLD